MVIFYATKFVVMGYSRDKELIRARLWWKALTAGVSVDLRGRVISRSYIFPIPIFGMYKRC